jgi:serine/threonine-protein kinase
MSASPGSETLLVPAERDESQHHSDAHDDRGYVRKRGRTPSGRTTTALPEDLLRQAAGRLRILALLYAFTFFMAAFFQPLLFPAARERLFSQPLNWSPGVMSIAVALAVAWVIQRARLGTRAVIAVALIFEVVSSYGIAAAEYLQPSIASSFRGPWIGLSWVAVWILLFNVVVPTVPRYAVLSALASITAVPVMVLLSLSTFSPEVVPGLMPIFLAFLFPYLLVVIMAYVAARVVYALGKEVNRARELGSYRLVKRLGTGGMGEVWKADHRLLARPAAIKLIRSPLPGEPAGTVSDEMRRRFEREAQLIAQLRSPHTVTLFDFGVTDNGSFYYVMELLEGLDADTMVRRFGPMPAERVVSVLRQICHSLSEAGACGLVHRDTKPANIFLCRYGEDHDFVKVLDFGIAKPVHTTSESATVLTMANVIRGTPAFIAPEQALGGDVDGRADIYSAGCVAYWLLTGELVFTAETPMKLLLAHAQSVPDPPSRRTELRMPPELDALILSCLAKDREHRPQSAGDLLRHLDAIPLAETWTENRAREWWNTHVPV